MFSQFPPATGFKKHFHNFYLLWFTSGTVPLLNHSSAVARLTKLRALRGGRAVSHCWLSRRYLEKSSPRYADAYYAYLLHTGLKGTLYRGRNYYFEMSRRGSLCYSREMIKKHVRNKPNSHFQKSYACSTKSMLAVVGRTISCQFEISKTRSVPTPKATGRIALMMLGTSKMDSPASN